MEGKINKKRVNFKLHAPEARDVFLAGGFNAWNHEDNPMNRNRNGTWKTTLSLAPGRYEYRFVVDGQWRDDPGNPERTPNEFGTFNSIILV